MLDENRGVSAHDPRYTNPVAWGLYGIIVTQMGNLDGSILISDGVTISIKDYLYDVYHYDYDFRWQVGPFAAAIA